ncbi:MAG TPA: hypothetical protein VMB26_11625 [Candidatus Binataceae bacterium]|nr:hypothetical protein [Candidatus Binataceae bacterium]
METLDQLDQVRAASAREAAALEASDQHALDRTSQHAAADSRRRLMYLMVFVLTFAVFVFSPVTELFDSKFSLLLSESLLTNHSPALNAYSIPGLDFDTLPPDVNLITGGSFYQLMRLDGKVLYYYPHGTSYLSLPMVAVLRGMGESVVSAGGRYDKAREEREQHLVASFLMALLACIFLRTAELMLPDSWSKVVAIGAAFGTQIWSTASRSLWSHTWEILLLGFVILELLSAEEKSRRLRPILLATLVSWMFFVRPTGALVVIGLSIYIFVYHRKDSIPFCVTGLGWLAGFITYSWYTFGQLLPGYYHNQTFHTFSHFTTAFAANLLSPSRGLFVFVPELMFVVFLLDRYWTRLPHRRLAVLALAISFAHLLIICGDEKWWGGWSFGPRLLTDLVPWFVLLAILSLRAFRDDLLQREIADSSGRKRFSRSDQAKIALGFFLLAIGIAINSRGAMSWKTGQWNASPHIDAYPGRVFDWREPQFLAGLVPHRR